MIEDIMTSFSIVWISLHLVEFAIKVTVRLLKKRTTVPEEPTLDNWRILNE